jgi:hypothetical protein
MQWMKIAIGGLILCGMFPVSGSTFNSVKSGDWTSTSTWNTVSVPAALDTVYVKGLSVTSSVSVEGLNGLGLFPMELQ